MKLAVELDQCAKGYGRIHKAGCRDLSDALDIGTADTIAEADTRVSDATGWEEPYSYAPCVKL